MRWQPTCYETTILDDHFEVRKVDDSRWLVRYYERDDKGQERLLEEFCRESAVNGKRAIQARCYEQLKWVQTQWECTKGGWEVTARVAPIEASTRFYWWCSVTRLRGEGQNATGMAPDLQSAKAMALETAEALVENVCRILDKKERNSEGA